MVACQLAFAVLVSVLGANPVSATTPLPACAVADVRTSAGALADWDHTLLDWTSMLSRTYAPADLVPVRRAGIPGVGSVRRIVVADLAAMTTAASRAGSYLAVYSAYRSYATQVATFRKWSRIQGYTAALRASARPGHSEHQLGTAIDFTTSGRGAPWGPGFDWGRTTAGSWMMKNAWHYGFVLSYPKGASSTVCYQYEPWHYRYVGRPVAQAIHASGLTPRAWFWLHPRGLDA